MDGDSSGGLAPIADVPKSLVKLYLAWAADFHGLKGFDLINVMEATAELRPPGRLADRRGRPDALPRARPAHVRLRPARRSTPVEILRRLWPAFRDHYGGDPAPSPRTSDKFVRMFCFAQWKRERFAISFRVTAFDLDPKTGFRFPPVQAPFTEELAELDRLVADVKAGRASLDDREELKMGQD